MKPIYKATYLNIDSNIVAEETDVNLLKDWADAIEQKIHLSRSYIDKLKSEDENAYTLKHEVWADYQELLAAQVYRRIEELENKQYFHLKQRVEYWKDVVFGMTNPETFHNIEREEP